MRQFVVSGANVAGEFTFISRVSDAAKSAGLTREDVIGHKWWSYEDGGESPQAKAAFMECLLEGKEYSFISHSRIGGRVEHWENRLIRVPHGTEVLAIAREIFPGTSPEVTEEELTILRLLSNDRTIKQIAHELELNAETLHVRMHRLRHKFGVSTNHGLLAKAVRFGVITENRSA